MRGIVSPSLVVMLLVVSGVGCASSRASESPQPGAVHHVVRCWLKEPGNRQHIEPIIRGTRKYASRPGVVSIAAGTSLASTRPVVDDGFDIGLVMTVASREALARGTWRIQSTNAPPRRSCDRS